MVEKAECQEVIHEGADLLGEGNGLDMLPIPISTPGFDSAPTLTATNVITVDPETGVQNMGTYRCALKAPDRMVVRMATRVGGAGGYLHYQAWKKAGHKTMPCAVVLGCPPFVAFMGPQKLPIGMDEFDVAGGLAGVPIQITNARTVALKVPAQAEIVIEGQIDLDMLEPEAPFGESHGHVALEVQPAHENHGYHASPQARDSFLHQSGSAERIECHQACGLRAFVLGSFARFFGHSRRQEGVFA